MKLLFPLFFCLIYSTLVFAQKNTAFVSPIDFPLQLSGNFGELRSGHFHAGLDIRTQAKTGLHIYSIADGFVSRIGISENDYGKVIYITHPNGYTSVYAHLRKFEPKIEKLVKSIQYQKHVFLFDSTLADSSFVVKKGEPIAFSGNTGGSAGPHLHFEIRNTATNKPINPLLFGYKIKDQIAPNIYALGVYPLNEQSYVNNKNNAQVIKTIKNGSTYTTINHQPIFGFGKIGFGVYTRDKYSNSPFKFGVYSIELYKNNKLVYTHQLDSLSFNTTRCINAHIDFYEYSINKRKIQKSFILPGNKLNTYKNVVNNGEFYFLTPNDTSIIKYIVKDFVGNESELNFKVITSKNNEQKPKEKTTTHILKYNQTNTYKDSILSLSLSPNCLYQDGELNIKYQEPIGRCVVPITYINSLYEPLNDYMEIGFNINQLDSNVQKKTIIVSLDKHKKLLAAEGGVLKNNWIVGKTRSFGPYSVFIDTIPPNIRLETIKNNDKVDTAKRIYFKAKDVLSGIGKYYATIDNKWILVEYEKNRNQLFFNLSDVEKTNIKRVYNLTVLDKVGNKTKLSGSFIY